MEERADLSAFRKPPSARILVGIFCIVISFPMGWPAVSALGALSIHVGQPLFVLIGGPLIYCLSHVTFLLGMYLAGAEYSVVFMKWWLRTVVEFFLDPSELPRAAGVRR